MKIFPSSSIKKLDAYTIENEPIDINRSDGTCSNRINKSHHRQMEYGNAGHYLCRTGE